MTPTFLYHFHGLGGLDFSDMAPADLQALDDMASGASLQVLPTIYLRRDRIENLEGLLEEFSSHEWTSIAGFAVEGPLLGPQGGIPRSGKWAPSAAEWARIAALGLKYIVMAPDAMALDDELDDGLTFGALLERLYDNGTRVALGHFHRGEPDRSADRMRDVLGYLHSRYESSPALVLTDHLYNDMPRRFQHAWRSEAAQARRANELRPLQRDWGDLDLHELLGPVPATMLEAAISGKLLPCINFDGQHVDLEISARTWQLLGSDRLIAMTDHTEVLSMADEGLTKDKFTGLLLRDDGAVAAGSAGVEHHKANMRTVGMSDQDIDAIFWNNPREAIAFSPRRRSA